MLKGKRKLITTIALATVLTFQGFSIAPVVHAATTSSSTGGTTTASSSTTSAIAQTVTINSYSDLVNALSNAVTNYSPTMTFLMSKSVFLSFQTRGDWFSQAYNDSVHSAGNDYQKLCAGNGCTGYTSMNTDGSYKGIYNFNYVETAAQSAAVKTKVDKILSQIITPGMTDEQKEKAICIWIYNSVSYDTSLTHFNAYNAVLGTGTTVCQGYSLLTYMMLTEAGIPARCVLGSLFGTGHAWNQVKINGNWYDLDNTLDKENTIPGCYSFQFFNMQDIQLASARHIWTASYYNNANTAYDPTDQQICTDGRSDDTNTALPNNAKAVTTVFRGLDVDMVLGGLSNGDSAIISSASGASIPSITADATGTAAEWLPETVRDDGYINVAIKHNGVTGPVTKVKFIPCSEFPTGAVTATSATSATSTTSATANVTVINSKFNAGDVIKMYATSGAYPVITTPFDYAPIFTTTVKAGSPNQIFLVPNIMGNTVYVTVTSAGKAESKKCAISITPAITSAPSLSNINVVNPTTGNPTVIVADVLNGTTVKVYNKAGTTLLGQVTSILLAGEDPTKYSVSVHLTSPLNQKDGAVLVSLTNNGMQESSKVLVTFKAH